MTNTALVHATVVVEVDLLTLKNELGRVPTTHDVERAATDILHRGGMTAVAADAVFWRVG